VLAPFYVYYAIRSVASKHASKSRSHKSEGEGSDSEPWFLYFTEIKLTRMRDKIN